MNIESCDTPTGYYDGPQDLHRVSVIADMN